MINTSLDLVPAEWKNPKIYRVRSSSVLHSELLQQQLSFASNQQ